MLSKPLLGLLLLPLAGVAHAQAIKTEPPMQTFSPEEIAAIEMPELAFDAADVNAKDYEKYFYFHRPDTSFDQAYADVLECDSLSSGINFYRYADVSQYQVYNPNISPMAGAIGGAIGGLIGNAIGYAIFGSSERRKKKRINIRNCMYFKGYDRYGLERSLWKAFHFEEGMGRKDDDVRIAALKQQARVASGPKPTTEVLVP